MKGPPIGASGEDITWPDQVAPRGRRTPSTRNVKPQTSNPSNAKTAVVCPVQSPTYLGTHFGRPQMSPSLPPRCPWRPWGHRCIG